MSDFSTARQKMVDGQVRPSDVTDQRIIEAMLGVPREAFVPEERQALTYLDLDLSVGPAGAGKRFLLKPVVVARLLQAAEIRDTDSVLVIGCASGYTVAIASLLTPHVRATDPDPAMVARAISALGKVNAGSVPVTTAPAAEGDASHGPYDVIVLDGATEIMPEGVLHQLKDGGRLVGVFATGAPMRAMAVTRSRDDFGSRILFDASAEVIPGFERVPDFVF